jgi:hypothetical protein
VALIVLIAVAIAFSSLTVEVSGSEFRWHFGPGLWSYSNSMMYRALDMMYRALDAVELHSRSNDIRRIGSDDPQGLHAP